MSTLIMKQYEIMDKIKEAAEVISGLIWQEGYENFRITQTGNVTGINELDVMGIRLEIENNEYVIITDLEDKLIYQDTMISMFLIDSLKNITIESKLIQIEFDDGEFIVIKPIEELEG